MEIDKRLTMVDINKLVADTGIPFADISDKEIENCLLQNIFLTTNAIYNSSKDTYSRSENKMYNILKIATIINEIKLNSYNYNYPICIWKDWDENCPGKFKYDTDGNGRWHIRAFYYCQKIMPLSVCIDG